MLRKETINRINSKISSLYASAREKTLAVIERSAPFQDKVRSAAHKLYAWARPAGKSALNFLKQFIPNFQNPFDDLMETTDLARIIGVGILSSATAPLLVHPLTRLILVPAAISGFIARDPHKHPVPQAIGMSITFTVAFFLTLIFPFGEAMLSILAVIMLADIFMVNFLQEVRRCTAQEISE